MEGIGRVLVGLALVAAGCGVTEAGAPDTAREAAALQGPPHIETSPDPGGTIASYSAHRFDAGKTDSFFSATGTNGRSCSTCHAQSDGWTLSAARAQATALRDPHDPLFAPVDGSDCPRTDVHQPADAANSILLVERGLIRVMIPVPAGADFGLVSATNPGHCALPPGDPSLHGALFLFRRPLPSANLSFLSAVMWDGRETKQPLDTAPRLTNLAALLFDLSSQDNDANLGHAEATGPILGTQDLADSVGFESSLYTAQRKIGALDLDEHGGHGGPQYLGQQVAEGFGIGENDPLKPGFDPDAFRVYRAWEPDEHGRFGPGLSDEEKAIGRGERLFNRRQFTIADVPGLNSDHANPLATTQDPLFDQPITGTCSTCHNSFDAGNHSTPLALNIGVTLAQPTDNRGNPVDVSEYLNTDGLPVYELRAGSRTVEVTDPGRALISGHFVDAGKTKGPVLRGLSARAPYFHNGSAKDLESVVGFYNDRFDIGLSEAEKADLVTFLKAL